MADVCDDDGWPNFASTVGLGLVLEATYFGLRSP